MFNIFPAVMIVFLFLLVAILGWIDQRKKRLLNSWPALSFLVPCYNDADTVEQTLSSIFETCGPNADVVVIDDCSTDDSHAKLSTLQRTHGFRLYKNSTNLGKSKTLNAHFKHTIHEIVVLVDADVIVSGKALEDAVCRLQVPGVGAVSCPYRSANHGFIPLMQTIEYNMLSFIQGAYNVFSTIALWGGFIVVKRDAFVQAGGFSLNAITEDMDLAFKLNRNGWRVEQSFIPILTYVPDTLSKWYRQKIRWSSGGLQCFVHHYRVWLKNPLHVLFLSSFCVILTFSTLKMGRSLFLWDEMYNYFNSVYQPGSFWFSLQLTALAYGLPVVTEVIWRIVFTLFSLPFVLPLVSTLKRLYICFLIIPFSMCYIPVFSSISLLGAVYFLKKRRLLKTAGRAW